MKKLLLILSVLFIIGCQSAPDGRTAEQNQGKEHENEEKTQNPITNDEGEEERESNQTESQPDQDDEQESTDKTDDTSNGEMTEEDAIARVRDYFDAEVGASIEMNYMVDSEDENGHYLIQVFEVVDHGEGETHTATYGWYRVNSDTGEVIDIMNE
ncbi:hypothetical protein SAMN04488134_102217 [Amphibacillus marinus]|uniref:Peptidase propeptide and YPEB domain-containing protein n=1 Tax=Amphibacillus marinus TaxID=872970 RepID=A0A1H8KAU6_9BACI|nr:hypothetical protein [Amphibacillus marinus]SEN89558.1 hypothetical protein SAMN04488134_102217 [Amphibacillus marinus]